MSTSQRPDKGEQAFMHGFFQGAASIIFFTPWVLMIVNTERYRSEFGEELTYEYGFAAFIVAAISYYFATKTAKRYSVGQIAAPTSKKDSRPEPRLPL